MTKRRPKRDLFVEAMDQGFRGMPDVLTADERKSVEAARQDSETDPDLLAIIDRLAQKPRR